MILHVNTSKEWRGGEQQLFYLALGLQHNGHKQIVVCQPDSPLENKCKEYQIEVAPIQMKGEWDWKAAKQIRHVAIEKQASLLHTNTAHAHSLTLLAKRKHLSIPLLVSRRVDFRPKSGLFSKWKYQHKDINYYLTVSQTIRDILLQSGISPEKVITVYSGIDPKRFTKLPPADHLREEFGIGKNELVITNIAALVDHKDQDTLIRSISQIQTSVPFKVLIVGQGPLEKRLKALANDLQVSSKIVFTGFRKDILEILSLTDIFTLTSKEEGLGTSVLDAMASGKPIIATSGGGIAEMLSPDQGAILCKVKDVQGLAKGFGRLLEDEGLRNRFGAFNKLMVKRFSYTETVKKTLLIYYSLLGESFLSD